MPSFIALIINLVILAIVAVVTIWGIGLFATAIGLALPAALIMLIKVLFGLYGLAMIIGFLSGQAYVPLLWNRQV